LKFINVVVSGFEACRC